MKKLLLLFAACVGIVACETPTPYGDLIISVLDDRGNEIDSAEVTLFLTQEDYNQETNAFLGPFRTDSEGGLKIFNLEDSVYFLNVTRNDFNNWENEVRIDLIKSENGFNNNKIVILSDSRSGMLSSPEGTTWSITSLSSSTFPEDCVLDNVLVFFKGGGFEHQEGNSKCSPSAPNTVVSSTWEINNEGTEITLGYTTTPWLIVSFNETEISLLAPLNEVFPGDPSLNAALVGIVIRPQS